MLRLMVATAALMALAGAAHAGCANFVDGSSSTPPPLVELCFGPDCEKTRMLYTCTTSDSVFSHFANGLRVDSFRDDKVYAALNGVPLSDSAIAALKCRPLDDAPDACSPL